MVVLQLLSTQIQKGNVMSDLLEKFMNKGYIIFDKESDAQSFAGELIWQSVPFIVIYEHNEDKVCFKQIQDPFEWPSS